MIKNYKILSLSVTIIAACGLQASQVPQIIESPKASQTVFISEPDSKLLASICHTAKLPGSIASLIMDYMSKWTQPAKDVRVPFPTSYDDPHICCTPLSARICALTKEDRTTIRLFSTRFGVYEDKGITDTEQHELITHVVAVSPETLAVTTNQGGVYIWDTEADSLYTLKQRFLPFREIKISKLHDNIFAVWESLGNTVTIWSLNNKATILYSFSTEKNYQIKDVKNLGSGKFGILTQDSTNSESVINILATLSGEHIATIKDKDIKCFSSLPNNLIAVGNTRKIDIYSVTSGEHVNTVKTLTPSERLVSNLTATAKAFLLSEVLSLDEYSINYFTSQLATHNPQTVEQTGSLVGLAILKNGIIALPRSEQLAIVSFKKIDIVKETSLEITQTIDTSTIKLIHYYEENGKLILIYKANNNEIGIQTIMLKPDYRDQLPEKRQSHCKIASTLFSVIASKFTSRS